jgi:hypothetical protein
MCSLGDSFLLSNPGREKKHLWVLVTAPDPATHNAIMVNITTRRNDSDTTTILLKGEHDFIDHPSVVFYADTRIVDVRLIETYLRKYPENKHQPLRRDVLQKIQAGIEASSFTPRKSKLAFREATQAGLV